MSTNAKREEPIHTQSAFMNAQRALICSVCHTKNSESFSWETIKGLKVWKCIRCDTIGMLKNAIKEIENVNVEEDLEGSQSE